MSMKLFVLSVQEWKLEEDKDGKKMDKPMLGAQVFAMDPDDVLSPQPPRKDDRGFVLAGTMPLKYTMAADGLAHLPNLPCMCECEIKMVKGLEGKAKVQIASIRPSDQQPFGGKATKAA
jgi:hypothetical protein